MAGRLYKDYRRKSGSGGIDPESVEGLRLRIAELEEQLNKTIREENINNGHDYFHDIFETVGEGIALTTLKGRVLSVNRRLSEMIGAPAEKIVGRNILQIAPDLLTQENLAHVLPLLKDIVLGKAIDPFNVKINNRILEVSANINRKTRRLTGTVRDVTQSKITEDALSKSEIRLIRAGLASRSGNWELNLDTKRILGSEG
ncbi:MAG TPA: PAS domain S-box protein, partial [Bacteroidales bacterium]|nr:PAS domain S-box protein [Bacteroidales bacterium]